MWHPPIHRVILAEHRVDFRKRFDGLLAEAYQLGINPYNGDCIVFISRDHTQIRVVVGDPLGLCLICRRFEGGCLKTSFTFARDPSCSTISSAELAMLFEGATFSVRRRVKPWK